MVRHRSPRVEKHWDLLVQMQWLIDSGVTRHGAAVMVANKHWRVITKGKYESAVGWLQDNYRKFRDELHPGFAAFEEIRAAREEWLSKLSPQERKRAEQHYEQELQRTVPAKRTRAERAALREARRRDEVESVRWQEWFKQDPKGAVYALIDELKAELIAELKFELNNGPS
jgi:hypothetical protein